MKRSWDVTNYSNKKVKFGTVNENPIYLPNMPIELLEEIINKLTFWEYSRVRGTCLPFRNAADNILIRRLMHNIRIFDEVPPSNTNVECICSKVFYQLSWPYLRYGYRSTAAGVYLSLLHSLIYSNSSAKFPPFLGTYIVQFCQCIDGLVGDPHTQLSRLLYVVTILGFLNKLTNINRKEKQINSKKLKLNFVMNGSLFGLLWSRNHRNTLVYPGDRNSLIIFLADIMTSNIIETPMRKMWDNEGSDRVVIFGNEPVRMKGKNKSASVLLEFIINGSNKLLEFLKIAPCAGDWDELPTDNFSVTINLTCKEVHKLGCPTNYSFKI